MEPPLDVDPTTLRQELIAVFREPIPSDHLEPFRFLTPLPVGRGVRAGSGQTEGGDRRALRGVPHLRIGADVADDHDLVEVRHLPSSSAARRRIEALGQSLRTRRYRRTSSVSLRPLSTSTARSGVICNWLTT